METLFDADQYGARDRAEIFRDFMVATSGALQRVRFLTDDPASARVRMSGAQLDPEVLFMREVSTGITHQRTTEHLRRAGAERVSLVLPDDGSGHYEHDGFCRSLRGGDLYVTDLNTTYTYYRPGAGAVNIIQVERARLEVAAETVRLADRQLARSPLYGVVRDHLRSLASNAPLLSSHYDRAGTAEATVALLKGLVRSAAQDDSEARSTVQDHLLERITFYVRTHATDSDLSPDEIAAAHAISIRKLFQVWQSQPRSLSESIVQLRLEAAQRRLIGQPNLPIAAVARACGFVDASHFSRRFRSALGCSPTDWRVHIGTGSGDATPSG